MTFIQVFQEGWCSPYWINKSRYLSKRVFDVAVRIQVCLKNGITPIHPYAFRMGLEPEKSYSRNGILGRDKSSCMFWCANSRRTGFFQLVIGPTDPCKQKDGPDRTDGYINRQSVSLQWVAIINKLEFESTSIPSLVGNTVDGRNPTQLEVGSLSTILCHGFLYILGGCWGTINSIMISVIWGSGKNFWPATVSSSKVEASDSS